MIFLITNCPLSVDKEFFKCVIYLICTIQSFFVRADRRKVVRTPTYVACAEMRKSTVYHLDVMVDSCGIVQESQCESAAGMGPGAHCKHVCVVLITLTTRVKGGIICLETCPQKLQTL